MQIKNRQQLLTLVTIAAVALLAVDKIIRPPLVSFWSDRAAQIKALKDQVNEGESLRKSRNFLHNYWTQIQAGTLTNNTTLAEQQLFTSLNRWSQSSGISIGMVTPQWKQGADATYKTLECRVEASGSMDRLSRFLYELEDDPMALKLQSVEMTSRDNNGTVIGMGVQISGLVLTSKDQAK